MLKQGSGGITSVWFLQSENIPQNCWQASLIKYSQAFKDKEKNGLGSFLRELISLCVPIRHSRTCYFHFLAASWYSSLLIISVWDRLSLHCLGCPWTSVPSLTSPPTSVSQRPGTTLMGNHTLHLPFPMDFPFPSSSSTEASCVFPGLGWRKAPAREEVGRRICQHSCSPNSLLPVPSTVLCRFSSYSVGSVGSLVPVGLSWP